MHHIVTILDSIIISPPNTNIILFMPYFNSAKFSSASHCNILTTFYKIQYFYFGTFLDHTTVNIQERWYKYLSYIDLVCANII